MADNPGHLEEVVYDGEQYQHMSSRFLWLLAFPVLLTGCASATYIRARVSDNPLPRVVQQAGRDWSVDQVSEDTLRLTDAWPIYSIMALGYGASHANLFYDPAGPDLYIQYYFRAFPLMTLWMPLSLDAEPGVAGGALKPMMNDQINEIVRWSTATQTSRRSGSGSEKFPPKTSAPLPSKE